MSEMRRLRNGSEELLGIIAHIYMVMEGLWEMGMESIPALYDLHQLCLDPHYRMGQKNANLLKEFGLLDEGGTVHNSISNVVLSAIEGEGLAMRLVSPLMEE